MSHGLQTDVPVTRAELLALRSQPAHVVGAASAEGIAVVRLLLALGFEQVTVHDMRPREELRRAFRTTHGVYPRAEQDALWETLRPTLDVGRFGDDYLDGIDQAALVVLGQGWYLDPDNRARLVAAVPAAARITGMAALYFELHRGPIAAITGTNGKSTTVALTEHLLAAGEVPHRTAGNERSSRQFLPEIDDVEPGTLALLEVSNRQLLQLTPHPDVAAITALTPDHLDEHGGFDGYRDTKARLFEGQRSDGVAVANADDPLALEVARRSPAAAAGRLVSCGTAEHPAPSVTWRDGELIARDVPLATEEAGGAATTGPHVVAVADDLRMPGEHNLRNAAVAVAMALACGVDPAVVAPALRSFSGKALRLQQLDEVHGVQVWSDLKSTTPESTVAAVSALSDRTLVLIAGGDDKGLEYEVLAQTLIDQGVRTLVVPGTATDKLERELVRLQAPADALMRVEDLAEALDQAFGMTTSGDCVIVSPAAAGFWTHQLQGGASLAKLVRQRKAATPQEVLDR